MLHSAHGYYYFLSRSSICSWIDSMSICLLRTSSRDHAHSSDQYSDLFCNRSASSLLACLALVAASAQSYASSYSLARSKQFAPPLVSM